MTACARRAKFLLTDGRIMATLRNKLLLMKHSNCSYPFSPTSLPSTLSYSISCTEYHQLSHFITRLVPYLRWAAWTKCLRRVRCQISSSHIGIIFMLDSSYFLHCRRGCSHSAMSDEEKEHIRYWKRTFTVTDKLLEVSNNGRGFSTIYSSQSQCVHNNNNDAVSFEWSHSRTKFHLKAMPRVDTKKKKCL